MPKASSGKMKNLRQKKKKLSNDVLVLQKEVDALDQTGSPALLAVHNRISGLRGDLENATCMDLANSAIAAAFKARAKSIHDDIDKLRAQPARDRSKPTSVLQTDSSVSDCCEVCNEVFCEICGDHDHSACTNSASVPPIPPDCHAEGDSAHLHHSACTISSCVPPPQSPYSLLSQMIEDVLVNDEELYIDVNDESVWNDGETFITAECEQLLLHKGTDTSNEVTTLPLGTRNPPGVLAAFNLVEDAITSLEFAMANLKTEIGKTRPPDGITERKMQLLERLENLKIRSQF